MPYFRAIVFQGPYPVTTGSATSLSGSLTALDSRLTITSELNWYSNSTLRAADLVLSGRSYSDFNATIAIGLLIVNGGVHNLSRVTASTLVAISAELNGNFATNEARLTDSSALWLQSSNLTASFSSGDDWTVVGSLQLDTVEVARLTVADAIASISQSTLTTFAFNNVHASLDQVNSTTGTVADSWLELACVPSTFGSLDLSNTTLSLSVDCPATSVSDVTFDQGLFVYFLPPSFLSFLPSLAP